MSYSPLGLIRDLHRELAVTVLFPKEFGNLDSGYRKVFTFYATTQQSDRALLEIIFEEFNIGTGPVARAYRGNHLRSLSVGDVVVLDGQVAYLCAAVGWEAFDLTLYNDVTT